MWVGWPWGQESRRIGPAPCSCYIGQTSWGSTGELILVVVGGLLGWPSLQQPKPRTRQGYELAHTTIHFVYGLLEHVTQSCRTSTTWDNNSIQEEPQWGPSIESVVAARGLKPDQQLRNEHLQVKRKGWRGLLLDALDRTAASMTRYFFFSSHFSFSFLFSFILGAGRLQGQRADTKGQGNEQNRDARCERHED